MDVTLYLPASGKGSGGERRSRHQQRRGAGGRNTVCRAVQKAAAHPKKAHAIYLKWHFSKQDVQLPNSLKVYEIFSTSLLIALHAHGWITF